MSTEAVPNVHGVPIAALCLAIIVEYEWDYEAALDAWLKIHRTMCPRRYNGEMTNDLMIIATITTLFNQAYTSSDLEMPDVEEETPCSDEG